MRRSHAELLNTVARVSNAFLCRSGDRRSCERQTGGFQHAAQTSHRSPPAQTLDWIQRKPLNCASFMMDVNRSIDQIDLISFELNQSTVISRL